MRYRRLDLEVRGRGIGLGQMAVFTDDNAERLRRRDRMIEIRTAEDVHVQRVRSRLQLDARANRMIRVLFVRE